MAERSRSSSSGARARARDGRAGADRRHHASGRLTARERIDALDRPRLAGYEIGLLAEPELRRETAAPGDAIVTGLARIGGRKVCVLAIDADRARRARRRR